MSKLKLLDLFSGIGGFSLGLESTGGFETIAFVEKDKFCQKVLAKNFNNITIEGEIRNVKGEKYEADIITSGFPCQPFSVAGKRKGKDDDRYLWDETIRVIRECKPKWFVGENVEGIVNIANGTVLQQIQQDLEKEGFEVQCGIIPASGIGAWHQRKRVWIIANSSSQRSSSQSIREHRELEKEIQRKKETGNKSSFRTPSSCPNVPNTNSGNVETGCERQRRVRQESEGERSSSNATNIRQTLSNSKSLRYGGRSGEECGNQGWNFQQSKQKGSEVRSEAQGCSSQTLSNTNSKGLQGCSLPTKLEKEQRQIFTERDIEKQQTWWEAQSKLCGIPHGISYELDKDRTNRIKALGNSIVPLIAREIGLAILEAEK
jgi:DNA (cytosine-5)-methyltransferase 1